MAYIVNGKKYEVAEHLRAVNWKFTGAAEGVRFTTDPPSFRSENQCECCGRQDIVELVAYSWEEVLGFGWAKEVVDG